jgi:hypothetical protein
MCRVAQRVVNNDDLHIAPPHALGGSGDGTGAVTSHDVKHVFLMTGADANTGWLHSRVALDAKGFIRVLAE